MAHGTKEENPTRSVPRCTTLSMTLSRGAACPEKGRQNAIVIARRKTVKKRFMIAPFVP